MNNTLQTFARNTIKIQLKECLPEQHRIFKLMYSPNNLELPIDAVVDNMPVEKLNWAMQQVENTVKINERDYAVYQTGRS